MTMPLRLNAFRWACALLACVVSSASRSEESPIQVSEAPAHVLRTGLELPALMATTYTWLDAHRLAVTTPPQGDEDAHSGLRRVVLVDSRTGAQKTLLDSGYISCANPHTGVVAAYVGELRAFLQGGNFPQPVLKWFHWDARRGQLDERPLAKGQNIHKLQCRAYEPGEDLNGQIEAGSAPVRYLDPGHGQIRWRYDRETDKRVDVHWEHEAQRRTLDVPAEEIAAFVEWMPYRSAYLLSPGIYATTRGQPQDLLPMTTMDLQGRLSRQPMPQDLLQSLKRLPVRQALVAPVRDGLLVTVPGSSDEGAGLYRYSQQGLKRLFCGRPPNQPPDFKPLTAKACFEDEPKVSPDGCKVAFVSRYDFEGTFPKMSLKGQIHVLDLCTKPAR